MMMGIVALDARPGQAAYFHPVDERQVQIEQDEAGGSSITDLSAAAPWHHLDFQFSATLQSVLHQPCDIGPVLDIRTLAPPEFFDR